jgi:imidazolonepropionase-like amidohydrolase
MLRNKVLAIAVAVLAAPAMAQTAMPQREKMAIVGATLIDVSGYGRSTNDVRDSVVLIDDGKINVAGPASRVPIPSGTLRIDAYGKFLIPGLIDGFGALRTQAFGNAYLYEGVTTVYVPHSAAGWWRRR